MNEKKDNKRNEVIAELQRVAALLHTNFWTGRQFAQYGNIGVTTIRRYFGSWNKAVQAAGLVLKPVDEVSKKKLSDEELLRSLVDLTIELGKKPTLTEMEAFGSYSVRPYRARWGTFSNALQAAYAQYGFPLESTSGVFDTKHAIAEDSNSSVVPSQTTRTTVSRPRRTRGKVVYGEPIDFRGLRHTPVNEQGVVYVFGMVSRELGFLIESVRTAYPDCEG